MQSPTQANIQANEQAISQLKTAIHRNPNDPALHYELAGMYLANLQTIEAMASYQQALTLAPNHPQILLQLGNTATAAHQYAEAAKYLKLCIQADPNNPAAHYNLGNTLRALGQFAEAANSYRIALTLAPNDADTHNNLGNVLRELGKLDETIACYERALKLNPQLHHALVHLIHQQQHICDWNNLNYKINHLRDILKQDNHAKIAPFAFLAMPGTTAKEQLRCASQWAQQQFGQLAQSAKLFSSDAAKHPNEKIPKDKVKVAYLSADFRLHPLAYLITEVLEQHDRTCFHISAYSYGPNDNSAERARIVQAVDHFEEIHHLNDIEAAKHIHAQGIDILVDLTGYTKNSRTGIVALKPAPISINWLGFAGSMGYFHGKSLFDYMIVDETLVTNPNHFSEQLILLPCYQPNNSQRPVGKPLDKVSVGLPQDAFVFCCFNQTFKITADVFAVWMRVLKKVPNSVLWLLDCNAWAKRNLLREATNAGIAAERMIFAPRVAIDQHLARHVHADVFLDTLPYNAHTTASDALWMGVPVVTCMGDTMASRVAASLLHTLGLDALINQNLPAYEAMALSLAHNPTMLAQYRAQLAYNRLLLFNASTYTNTLEEAYVKVYKTAVTHS